MRYNLSDGRKKMLRKIFTILIMLLIGLFVPMQEARADLTITPTRVVFLARGHSVNVTLINLTDHPNTYRLGWQIMKADDKGKYILVPVTQEMAKDPYSV